MLATSYLPRGWPPKYFHREESLRPCSGWERVVSSCLVTKKLVCQISVYSPYSDYLFQVHSKLHKDIISSTTFSNLKNLFSYSACAIKDCFVRFAHNGGVAKPPLRNLLVLSFDKPTLLRRFVHLSF